MSEKRWMRVLALSLICGWAHAATPRALSVTPSTNWYGDDGTWSAISIRVGSPEQWVDVLPSTVSSETWVVGTYGCDNNTICSTQRGGLFDFNKSTTWTNQGYFYLEGNTQDGYGQYGLDDLTFGTTGVSIQNAIIASINETEFWIGEFGLGIVPGNFTDVTSLSAISNLVEKAAAIPSHSYGFTAGATYQQKGETLSLTLGGYDANRFVPHNTTFDLNPSQNPQVYINSVSVSSSASSNNWTTPVSLLSTVDRVSAVIDSTTPYLWFPQSVCERFASSLGLTYNESLNVYTFGGNSAQHNALENAQLTFTFALSNLQSSGDNVNITLPYEAFDLQLTYPAIPGTSYGASNSSAYYFPLKQATNEAQYVIGRAFLQEAYMITDYERNTFSVHQAVHVADPIGNTSIVSITRPSDSTLSAPPTSSKKGLSKGAIVGIVFGVTIFLVLLSLAIFALIRRRRQPSGSDTSSEKPSPQPQTFLSRFRRHHPRPSHEITGSATYPTEVGADFTHERFELPAPLPVELDSESGTLYGTTEHGSSTQDSVNISAYERARRKLERQQNATSPRSATTDETYPIEKSDHDISPVAHYRSENSIPDTESPLVSPVGGEGSGGSLTMSGTPSPVSPGFGARIAAQLSPPPTYRGLSPQNVVYAGRLPDNVQLPRIVPRIIGPDGSTIRAEQTLETEGGTFGSGGTGGGESSLGSEFTEMQDREERGDGDGEVDLYGSGSGSERGASAVDVGAGPEENPRAVREEDESKFLREDIQGLRAGIQTRGIPEDVVRANGRRLQGEDLVHVPQPAENRFSFEEERLDGTE